MNKKLVQEEEVLLIQDVRTTNVEKAKPQELILNLLLFNEDESIRANDF